MSNPYKYPVLILAGALALAACTPKDDTPRQDTPGASGDNGTDNGRLSPAPRVK